MIFPDCSTDLVQVRYKWDALYIFIFAGTFEYVK